MHQSVGGRNDIDVSDRKFGPSPGWSEQSGDQRESVELDRVAVGQGLASNRGPRVTAALSELGDDYFGGCVDQAGGT